MKNNKALIYFSNTGTTKKIADKVSEKFSPDIIEIKLKKPYGKFTSSVGRYIKQRILNREDLVETEPVDLSIYDTVFIGSPVWAGKLPDFVAEFLKKCTIRNKRIIPFISAAKTGKVSTLKEIKEIFSDSKITDYFFYSQFGKEEPTEWLNQIDLD